MKYIVLLRGINISGKNKISMDELKEKLVAYNYRNVITYLNSGNIILESDKDSNYIKDDITKMIKKEFNLDIPTLVIKYEYLLDIYNNLPDFSLRDSKEYYNNIIFTIGDIKPIDIINKIGDVNDDIDLIEYYKDVIYWSYDLKRYQKSIWWKKTASLDLKNSITIRTVNTIKKLIELCNK